MDITAIAVVGIIAYAIVSVAKGPRTSKKNKAFESQLQSEHTQMQQDMQIMAERIAVLETIVTDEKYQLNKKFEGLE